MTTFHEDNNKNTRRIVIFVSGGANPVVQFDGSTMQILTLQHPRYDCQAKYLLLRQSQSSSNEGNNNNNNDVKPLLLELQMTRRRDHGSWFIENQVLSDSTFYMATPCDPLFLLLPALLQSRFGGNHHHHHKDNAQITRNDNDREEKLFQGYFCPLEQILFSGVPAISPEADDATTTNTPTNDADADVDGKSPRVSSNCDLRPIMNCQNLNLEFICDIKEIGDERMYRLNDDKVVDWLCKKAHRIAQFLQQDSYFMATSQHSAQSSNFIKSMKQQNETTEPASQQDKSLNISTELLVPALAMLSEYVSTESSQFLQMTASKLGVDFESVMRKKKAQPILGTSSSNTDGYGLSSSPNFRAKTDTNEEESDNSKKRKKPAPNRGTAKLAKVDTSGMKAITSFFKKKEQ